MALAAGVGGIVPFLRPISSYWVGTLLPYKLNLEQHKIIFVLFVLAILFLSYSILFSIYLFYIFLQFALFGPVAPYSRFSFTSKYKCIFWVCEFGERFLKIWPVSSTLHIFSALDIRHVWPIGSMLATDRPCYWAFCFYLSILFHFSYCLS